MQPCPEPNPVVRRAPSVHPSLVDVAFSLVFLFLILSTLAVTATREERERTLPPVQLAEHADPPQETGLSKTRTVVVTVGVGPKYFVDAKEMPLPAIEALLKKTHPPELEVRGDVRVAYGAVAEVLRIAQETGIRNVALTYQERNNSD